MLIAGGRSSVAWATTKALVRRRDTVLGTHTLRPEQDYRRPVPVLLVYGQRDHLGQIALSTRAWTHPFAGRGCGA